jgi:hypothetical protein
VLRKSAPLLRSNEHQGVGQNAIDRPMRWWSGRAASKPAPGNKGAEARRDTCFPPCVSLHLFRSRWDRHVLPNIGGLELRQPRPAVLAQLQRDGLSPASVKKVAGMLQGVLQRAVEWERIA